MAGQDAGATEGQIATLTNGDGEPPVVWLRGEIDIAGADAARAVMDEAVRVAERSLVVDLSGVTFFDSSGLGLLVATKDAAAEKGVELAVRSPSDSALRTLELGGAIEWFGLDD